MKNPGLHYSLPHVAFSGSRSVVNTSYTGPRGFYPRVQQSSIVNTGTGGCTLLPPRIDPRPGGGGGLPPFPPRLNPRPDRGG